MLGIWKTRKKRIEYRLNHIVSQVPVYWKILQCCGSKYYSVADPVPYVFGPPRSVSISTRYGSRSGFGSFYCQAKIVIKNTLIPAVLWLLCDFLSLKNDVNVASKRISKNTFFSVAFLKVTDENSRSADLDPDPRPDPLVRCADLDPY